jgi:hypothetical protein
VPLVLAGLGAALGSLLYIFDGRLALRETRRSAVAHPPESSPE